MPYLLALVASVLYGLRGFLGGSASRRRPAAAVVGVSQTFLLVVFVVLSFVTGAFAEGMSASGWVWAAIAGTAELVALVSFYAALACGTMGVVAPIAAMGVALPVVVGLLSGERPSSVQMVGVVLGILGGVLASGPEVTSRANGRSIVLSVISAVAFGMVLLALARGGEESPMLTMIGMRVASVIVLAAVALATRSFGGVKQRDLPLLVTIGALDGMADFTYTVATTIGLLSLTAVLASLYPAVTAVLARVLHGERMSRTQDVGVVTVMVGILMVAGG